MSALDRALRRTLLQLGQATDRSLLERFAAAQEQAAFEELLRRHGSMVLQVCRRALGHAQDAEDAFQATFVVLARKAAAVAEVESVGGWLHGIAFRTALNAKKQRARRQEASRALEQRQRGKAAAPAPAGSADERELRAALDEALGRLPATYQSVLVLCYLEGKSHEEAARQLGCEVGAVGTRLMRARRMLRDRLAGTGATWTGAALATALTPQPASTMPAPLRTAALKAACAAAVGGATAAPLSTPAVHWVKRLLLLGAPTKARLCAAVVIAAVLAGAWAAAARLRNHEPGIVSSGQPGELERSWHLASIGATYALPAAEKTISALAYSPDGKWLAVGSQSSRVQVVDTATGAVKASAILGGNQPFASVAFTPDSRFVAAAGTINVRYIEVATNSTVIPGGLFFTKPRYPGQIISRVGLSSDGRALAVEYSEGAFELLCANKVQFSGSPGAAESRPVPNWAGASVSSDGNTMTWLEAREPPVLVVKDFVRNSQRVAVTFPQRDHVLHDRSKPFCGARSPDGKTFAVRADADHAGVQEVVLWDLETGKQRARLRDENGAPLSLAFSPDGQALAVGGQNEVTIWSVATGRQWASWKSARLGPVYAVAFALDGECLAVGDTQGVVTVWNTQHNR